MYSYFSYKTALRQEYTHFVSPKCVHLAYGELFTAYSPLNLMLQDYLWFFCLKKRNEQLMALFFKKYFFIQITGNNLKKVISCRQGCFSLEKKMFAMMPGEI